MDIYRQDNTEGYGDEELKALNDEIQGILSDYADSAAGDYDPDEVERIIKQHADDVARR